MIKQELGLKQQQKLSPLQIQTIKLIELPIQDLEQRIRKEIEENPVLDDGPAPEGRDDEDDSPKDVSLSELNEDDPIPSYKLKVNNYGKDERPEYNTFSVKQSFTQSLMEQLGFRDLDEHQRMVAALTTTATSGATWTVSWMTLPSGQESRPTRKKWSSCSP